MREEKLVIPASVGANGDDVTTWALPEGAVARLGQGLVQALALSSDGHYSDYQPISFSNSVTFSSDGKTLVWDLTPYL